MSELEEKINGHIVPWRWAIVAGAIWVSLSVLASMLGVDDADAARGAPIELLIYSFIFGAIFGGVTAYAIRVIIKAIRC